MVYKTIFSLVCALLVSSFFLLANFENKYSDNSERVMISEGTGFFIDPNGYLLTAAHVIKGKQSFYVNYKGKTVEADFIYADYAYDFAILKIDGFVTPYFSLEKPVDKEQIIVLGYPNVSKFGFYLHKTKGIVNFGFFDPPDRFTFDALSCHGNSGGPVVSSTNSALGIVVVGYNAFNTPDKVCSYKGGALRLDKILPVLTKLSIKFAILPSDVYTKNDDKVVFISAWPY